MRAIDADNLISLVQDSTILGDGFKMAFVAIVRGEPTIQPEQRWIPCSERLPEDDTVVLVCGRSGGVYTAIHNNSKTWIRGWWKMNSKNHHCNPTAWMPLPEPWEGEPK